HGIRPASYACRMFVFNHAARAEIYTLSLHDALPIFGGGVPESIGCAERPFCDHRHLGFHIQSRRSFSIAGGWNFRFERERAGPSDRKSTRLNSSHVKISYAVFCLKKKRETTGNSMNT